MSETKKIFDDQAEMPLAAISEGDMRWNKTGSWRNVRPYYDNKTSPCIVGCTAGEDIQGYIALAKQRRYEEAVRLIWERNPFPAICGRVCYHPCMSNCARKDYDDALFIPAIERFLGDFAIGKKLREEAPAEKRPHTVAVIGGGPSGIACAYFLAKKGYRVTVFEKRNKLGGVLRYGIPSYRLPKDILDAELERVLDLGIEARTGTSIGHDISIEDLSAYDAYFLGVGLQRSRALGIPGEDAEGVVPGLEFLAAVNEGTAVSIGAKVVVIGGGNTAMDVARSALRMGSDVTVLYRRTESEMPAIQDEVKEAKEEGVEFRFLAAPIEIIERRGTLRAITCQEMELGEPDESGRRRPVPKPGAVFEVAADSMLIAAGELPDTDVFAPLVDVKHGLIVADDFGRTSDKRFFAGGDIVTGAATVVDAVARGRSAADLIDAELTGGAFSPGAQKKVVSIADLNTAYFFHQKQARMPRIGDARASFDEVNEGLSEDTLRSELDRCFSCGVCNSCDNCWVFCPDVAIARENGVYSVQYDYCKGCLICVEECPRAALSTEKEGK
jgi:NADPH-dependent glutamate synthase beta subunit-like oxidoreductase/Pyruvate/2-oxoacid:ferredoxin oxidoreductase delta subunit